MAPAGTPCMGEGSHTTTKANSTQLITASLVLQNLFLTYPVILLSENT